MKASIEILAVLITVACFTIGLGFVSNAMAQVDPLEAAASPSPMDAGMAVALDASSAQGDAGPDAAATAPDPIEDPVGLVTEIVSAIRSGDWKEATALVLVFVSGLFLWAARRSDGVKEWLKENDWAAVVFVFATSIMGAIGTSLLADSPVDFGMFRAAFTIAILAAGGYAVIFKKLLIPLWAKIRGK